MSGRTKFIEVLLGTVSIILLLMGCSPEIARTPTQISTVGPDEYERQIVFTNDVTISLSSGYSRAITKNSTWRFVGSIKEGDVFRPVGTVFTIEGAHVREAYLVIENGRLTGFYIPGEDSFSRQSPSIALPIHGGK